MHSFLRYSLALVILVMGMNLHAGDYVISLRDLTVTSKLKGFHVERVISVWPEESCIGFVQTGMFNRQEPVFMKPTVAGEIEDCLKRSFPASDSTKPLIIRINRLYIYEVTGSSREVACMQVSVSFITHEDTGYTDQFQAVVSLEKSGLDVTGFHAGDIIYGLGCCFDDFERMGTQGKLKPKRINESEMLINPLDHTEKFAIFTAPAVSRGLYKSFYSFRDNRPDTVTAFTVDYHPHKKDSMQMRATLNLPHGLAQKQYFAFTDGKMLYAWTGKGFAPVYRSEKQMSLWLAKNEVEEGASSGAYMAGMMGGMIGGLIGGALFGALAALNESDAGYIANGNGNFKIDFSSGRLSPSITPDYLKTESNTIFFNSKSSSGDDDLILLRDRDTLCTLAPGNYLKLALPSKYRELKLVVTCKTCSRREESISLRLFHTDIYILRVKKNREIFTGEAYEQVRKDLLGGMTSGNTRVLRSLPGKPPED